MWGCLNYVIIKYSHTRTICEKSKTSSIRCNCFINSKVTIWKIKDTRITNTCYLNLVITATFKIKWNIPVRCTITRCWSNYIRMENSTFIDINLNILSNVICPGNWMRFTCLPVLWSVWWWYCDTTCEYCKISIWFIK